MYEIILCTVYRFHLARCTAIFSRGREEENFSIIIIQANCRLSSSTRWLMCARMTFNWVCLYLHSYYVVDRFLFVQQLHQRIFQFIQAVCVYCFVFSSISVVFLCSIFSFLIDKCRSFASETTICIDSTSTWYHIYYPLCLLNFHPVFHTIIKSFKHAVDQSHGTFNSPHE